MQIVKSVPTMQRLARRWQARKIRVGLVPTMGYLHEGHLSLVRRARQLVGKKGKVVVSIYVNPTQFGPNEDLARYPRDLARDLKSCRAEGADVVFAPDDRQMYPRWSEATDEPAREDARPTAFSTYVVEEKLSNVMEGKSRPTHFRGVTTVVAKLFNIVQPGIAVFGAKDFQQGAIIKRMVRDLNFPVRIVVAPTVREPDGVAMSSRNKYLRGPLRMQAIVLWHAIQKARAAVRKSKKSIPAGTLEAELRKFIESEPAGVERVRFDGQWFDAEPSYYVKRPAARVDYIEFFDPDTLAPVSKVARGMHMALAVFVGKTRLIDNALL